MIKVLFDTNIILDIALERESFFIDSNLVFSLIDQGAIEGFITATSVTDIYYIASKQTSKSKSKSFLIDLVQIVDVIGVDKDVILNAIKSEMKDFEDAAQAIAAEFSDIEIIVTRNVEDFKNCNLTVLEPKELLRRFKK